jgi:putative ABC transport system permease protein
MLKNYLKIALRNLLRNKVYSFINIGGLAVGMAVAMLIGLWVWDELSFNKYHHNYDDIAHVRGYSTDPNTGETDGTESMQFPMGAVLKNSYKPYFKHVLMAFWAGSFTLSDDTKKIPSKGKFFEPGVIDMLSLKMLKGTNTALNDPHSIILAQSKAKAIFGDADPLNKTLKIDNRMDVTVTGVYEDLPRNTQFGEVQFFSPWALWVSSNEWIKRCENSWDNNSFSIYVQVQPNTSIEAANTAFKGFYSKSIPKELAKEWAKYKPELYLNPMKNWHLYSEFKNGLPAGGRITFVWLFGIVGIFVLLLACINFINLSTARSEKRGKEVGIRKAIGSARGALIFQFLSESFLVVVLAFVLSILLVNLSLSWFNELAGKDLSLPFSNPFFWLLNFAFITITGFLAGLYPAFYLSSFQPVKVLKGAFRLGRFASMPRKVLVVVQFTVSVVLIIGTIVVYQQIQYARNRPIGYNREGLVSIPMNDPNYVGKHDVMKRELLNTGMISEMALSSSPLTAVWNNVGGYTWVGKDPELSSDFAVTQVTHDFGKLASWNFLAGRDFSKSFTTDSLGVILNETAAKYISSTNKSPKELIGKYIKSEDGKTSWQILGIIKDMIMQSPYEPVKRSFYYLDYNYTAASLLNLKIKPNVSANDALPKIEAVLKNIVPSALFSYEFVDEEYAKKFSQEQRIGKLATFFAILAIFISCLGLFGLASFVAEQRTKEIGIRKVLGATVANLWQLLSKDFVVLVIISCLIAAPIAYYFMNQWLQKYTYRTEISWWIFVAAGAGALLITLLTVSYQAIKVALANPVKSLRTE